MTAYRHCSGCGRAFDQKTWQRESYCGSCGEPLKTQLRRVDPLDIHPCPERSPPLKPGAVINDLINQLKACAKAHPYWFSAGALVAGAGGILLGPGLVTLGQSVAIIGAILVGTGMLSVAYVEKAQAEKWIAAGLVTLVAGAGIALIGYALTAAGVVAVVGGSGIATKATVQSILRKRIEKQLRDKNINDLLRIARQLEN